MPGSRQGNFIPENTPWDGSRPGLDQHLALSSIKEQISFLIIWFQRPYCFAFLHHILCIRSGLLGPTCTTSLSRWKFNLVLLAVQIPPFWMECIREILLSQVALLIAIISVSRVSKIAALSCKEPFWFFKVSILPKVVSFHLSLDFVLASLYSGSS